jgi:hypothetical protein
MAAEIDRFFPADAHVLIDVKNVIKYVRNILVVKCIIEFEGAVFQDQKVEILLIEMDMYV